MEWEKNSFKFNQKLFSWLQWLFIVVEQFPFEVN